MELTEEIRKRIRALPGQTHRDNPQSVLACLVDLRVQPSCQLGLFLLQYKLSAFPGRAGEELMDVASPTNQLLSATRFVREVWELPDDYICLTSAEGEGAYLYSIATGEVYDFSLANRDAFLASPGPAIAKDFNSFVAWWLGVDE